MIGSRGSRKAVLEYMRNHKDKGLTSKEAFVMFGVTRLAAIIFELRKHHDVDTVMIESVNRYGEHTSYAKYMYRGEKND